MAMFPQEVCHGVEKLINRKVIQSEDYVDADRRPAASAESLKPCTKHLRP